jgi:Uncharacterized conserved protein
MPLDVIDCVHDRYLHSIPNLTGVAGALVSDERNLIFTSNRGENTVGIFAPDNEAGLAKVGVGIRPNGLAYDPDKDLLLASNVGDPDIPDSFTLSIVNVKERRMTASVLVPGRTRWTVFDAQAELFYVNIAAPAQILVLSSDAPDRIARTLTIPAPGPHGLDFDPEHRRLFCACDAKQLVILKADSGEVLKQLELSGSPDVIFFNRVLRHLYVAIGDPGVVEVFDTTSWSESKQFRLNAALIPSGSTPNVISSMPSYLKHIAQPFTPTKVRGSPVTLLNRTMVKKAGTTAVSMHQPGNSFSKDDLS